MLSTLTPALTLGIDTVLIISISVIFLGPLFYWLLTDARPEPSHR